MHNRNNTNRGKISNGGFSIPNNISDRNDDSNSSGFINVPSYSNNVNNNVDNSIGFNSNRDDNYVENTNVNSSFNLNNEKNVNNINNGLAKKKRKKKKKNKFIFSLIVLALVFFAGCFCIYKTYFDNTGNLSPTVQEIIDEHHKNPDKEEEEEPQQPYENLLPSFRQQYNNNYIAAQLQLPSVKIDTLITQAQNNNYYLNHNLYNQYDEMGTSFIDFRNHNIDTDRQVNIYGHNTQYSQYYDKLPFTNLEAYTDEGVFNNYKDVYFSTDLARYKYRVIAVKIVTNSDNEHMKVKFDDDNDWLQHTRKLLSNTMYIDKEHSFVGINDKLLILQACHYNPMNSYILIICKRVN